MRIHKQCNLQKDETDWKKVSAWDRMQKVNPTVLWFADQCLSPDLNSNQSVTYQQLFDVYQQFCSTVVSDSPYIFQREALLVFHLRVLLPWHFEKRRRITKQEYLQGATGVFVPAHFRRLHIETDFNNWHKGNMNQFRRAEMSMKARSAA